MTIREHQRLQRVFDTARPANCRECGALVAMAPTRNGVQVKYDLDDNSDPTLNTHVCAMRIVKAKARERLRPSKS